MHTRSPPFPAPAWARTLAQASPQDLAKTLPRVPFPSPHVLASALPGSCPPALNRRSALSVAQVPDEVAAVLWGVGSRWFTLRHTRWSLTSAPPSNLLPSQPPNHQTTKPPNHQTTRRCHRAGFVLVYVYTREDTAQNRQPGQKSAYSVFNKDCEKIDGTYDAEQFDKGTGLPRSQAFSFRSCSTRATPPPGTSSTVTNGMITPFSCQWWWWGGGQWDMHHWGRASCLLFPWRNVLIGLRLVGPLCVGVRVGAGAGMEQGSGRASG